MRILIIGRGGREHAIAWKMAQSALKPELFIAPGNVGMNTITAQTGAPVTLVNIGENETEALRDFALSEHIDLTVVGPEAALANDIATVFAVAGLRIFAPTAAAARIETSKEFAKDLMQKYRIPTAAYRTFEDYDNAKRYLDEQGAPIVIKYDGLAAGKGVVVAMTAEEADNALKDMLLDNRFGKGKVVMEEFLQGPEFSLLTLVNGEQVVPLVIAQDHKRAYDGDKGPNTGGMGAYSPVPVIPQAQIDWAVENIMKPTAKALIAEGCPFCGVLYGGLMLTKDGPKVIEFNARFGDPETEVVLPKLESDLTQMMLDILDHKEVCPKFHEDAFLGVVLAANGYPGSYTKNIPLNDPAGLSQQVFCMGVKEENGQLLSNGGRVLIVVGRGKTLKEAQQDAYQGVAKMTHPDLFHRKDIGWQAV
ncbi:MAG: phosphoribosylamine--glycine ligase [Bacteroidales bacterium]|nr:phosphoribosylamine--glycine ligase [Bacteroidales bacterium]